MSDNQANADDDRYFDVNEGQIAAYLDQETSPLPELFYKALESAVAQVRRTKDSASIVITVQPGGEYKAYNPSSEAA